MSEESSPQTDEIWTTSDYNITTSCYLTIIAAALVFILSIFGMLVKPYQLFKSMMYLRLFVRYTTSSFNLSQIAMPGALLRKFGAENYTTMIKSSKTTGRSTDGNRYSMILF